MVNIAFQTLYRFKQPRTIPRRNLVCYLHLHLCIPPLVNHDPETSLFSRTGKYRKVHVCKSEFPLKLPRRMWYGWNRVSFLPTTMAKSGPEFCSKYPKNPKVHTHTHTHTDRQTVAALKYMMMFTMMFDCFGFPIRYL